MVDAVRSVFKKYRVCDIVRLFEDGENPTHISKIHKVSRTTIVRYLQSHGYSIKRACAKEKLDYLRANGAVMDKTLTVDNGVYESGYLDKSSLDEMVRLNNLKRLKKK